MSGVVGLLGLVTLWVGTATCLAQTAWGRRRALRRRLEPFLPRAVDAGVDLPASQLGAGAAVLSPAVLDLLDRVSRALGAHDELATRLLRADDQRSPVTFRSQQLAGSVVAVCLGAAVAVGTGASEAGAIALLIGAPAAWIVGSERRLDARVADEQRRLRLELPVVGEQLAILIGAGYSLPAALQRLAERGRGRAARDLGVVSRELRRGVPEAAALAGWEARSGLPAVGRLVKVLAMHRDAGDLGQLVAAEARATRAESHRTLIETIERRAQLVWIPVTVATLVPGLILLAVPFIAALRQVAG
ncbi:MAG: type II secretion system F family protein [Acidobacteria bacterium]|nr:type II secretion system F family protein [Acidobacteriota bacterium]